MTIATRKPILFYYIVYGANAILSCLPILPEMFAGMVCWDKWVTGDIYPILLNVLKAECRTLLLMLADTRSVTKLFKSVSVLFSLSRYPIKHKRSIQCSFNVGPLSLTLAQHQPFNCQIIPFEFSPTWSCVSLTRSTISSEWKLFRFHKWRSTLFNYC